MKPADQDPNCVSPTLVIMKLLCLTGRKFANITGTLSNECNTFDWFDSLRPSQQLFSHVRTGLPGLNQDKMSCSKTQHSDSAFSEACNSNTLIKLPLNKTTDGTI